MKNGIVLAAVLAVLVGALFSALALAAHSGKRVEAETGHDPLLAYMAASKHLSTATPLAPRPAKMGGGVYVAPRVVRLTALPAGGEDKPGAFSVLLPDREALRITRKDGVIISIEKLKYCGIGTGYRSSAGRSGSPAYSRLARILDIGATGGQYNTTTLSKGCATCPK